MYERFSERARKVMRLANQEAQRFNHEYIGTEHVLLALVREGSGVAATALKNLDIDFRNVRLEVEKIVQTMPDIVLEGKLSQTPRAKKVIEYAIEETRNLNHDYVGTEHLLLGLLREQGGAAGQVLTHLGLTVDRVRVQVRQLFGGAGSGAPSSKTVPVELRGHPLVLHLKRMIDELDFEKEECVARQDFERATAIRDQGWQLLRSLQLIVEVLTANPNLGQAKDSPEGQ
jgi:hypothetical protein